MTFRSLAAVNRAIVSCERCPRLRAYCRRVAREKKREFRAWEYWGEPVPGFGDPRARLLIVGLAPGAHGSNRTGRMFTGDSSGTWLYEALHRFGFASRPEAVSRDDGLELRDCYVVAAARCAPPANKPSPSELERCRPYLAAELRLLRARSRGCDPRPGRARELAPDGGLVGGARAARAAALHARRDDSAARRDDADLVLPPQPAKHQHRKAHASDVARGVSPRAGDPRRMSGRRSSSGGSPPSSWNARWSRRARGRAWDPTCSTR
jgi:uracil-DNA glycosylase